MTEKITIPLEPTEAEFDAAWEALMTDEWKRCRNKLSLHDVRTLINTILRASRAVLQEEHQRNMELLAEAFGESQK